MNICLSKSQLDYLASQIVTLMKNVEPQKMLTTRQKAEQLGIKPGTLRKAANEGRIDCEKRGNEKQARLCFTADSRIIANE